MLIELLPITKGEGIRVEEKHRYISCPIIIDSELF